MANIIFTKWMEQYSKATWEGGVIRCMLERSTSTYVPDVDHEFVDDLTNFLEISVSSYARQTLDNAAVVKDDANDRIELDSDNIAFGNLESGQTVKAMLFYVQVGGDDSTPEDDILIAYFDTDSTTLFPLALAGGAFNVTINAEGLLQQANA